MFFLCKKVISVSLEAPVSLLTQLLKVEECVHGTGAMCTSVVTPLSVVMKVEESVQWTVAMCTSVGTPFSVRA